LKAFNWIGQKKVRLLIQAAPFARHLGDKTRMDELVKDENAYIRPSASGDTLWCSRKHGKQLLFARLAGLTQSS
jgi:LAO/AO transport system kinase